eukprot:9232475-Pyramimonas_sp.AAC.1
MYQDGRALDMAKVSPEDVDLIILCTSTADDIFGSACMGIPTGPEYAVAKVPPLETAGMFKLYYNGD